MGGGDGRFKREINETKGLAMASRRTSIPFQLPMPGILLAAMLVAGVSLFCIGCGEKNAQAGKPAAVDVEVAQVEQRDVPIYGEWIGTLDGLVDADVRAQVDRNVPLLNLSDL